MNLTFTCLSLECMVYTYYVNETIYQHEKIGNTYVYLVMLSTVIAIILWITSDISGKFYYLDTQGNCTTRFDLLAVSVLLYYCDVWKHCDFVKTQESACQT